MRFSYMFFVFHFFVHNYQAPEANNYRGVGGVQSQREARPGRSLGATLPTCKRNDDHYAQ